MHWMIGNLSEITRECFIFNRHEEGNRKGQILHCKEKQIS